MEEEDWVGEHGLGRLVRRQQGSDRAVVRGSDFRVTSMDVYEKGMKIEWTISPEPDVSDVAVDEIDEGLTARVPPQHLEEARSDLAKGRRIDVLLGEPRVVDQDGVVLDLISSGVDMQLDRWDGRITVQLQDPRTLRAVIVHLAGIELSIPLTD